MIIHYVGLIWRVVDGSICSYRNRNLFINNIYFAGRETNQSVLRNKMYIIRSSSLHRKGLPTPSTVFLYQYYFKDYSLLITYLNFSLNILVCQLQRLFLNAVVHILCSFKKNAFTITLSNINVPTRIVNLCVFNWLHS